MICRLIVFMLSWLVIMLCWLIWFVLENLKINFVWSGWWFMCGICFGKVVSLICWFRCSRWWLFGVLKWLGFGIYVFWRVFNFCGCLKLWSNKCWLYCCLGYLNLLVGWLVLLGWICILKLVRYFILCCGGWLGNVCMCVLLVMWCRFLLVMMWWLFMCVDLVGVLLIFFIIYWRRLFFICVFWFGVDILLNWLV